MASTLGALWSQTTGFSVATTAGTAWSHALGYTPTIILLTPNVAIGSTAAQYGYTSVNTNSITITLNNIGVGATVDVLVGSLHSLIR